ncbi:phage holin family protein [Paenibacillus sp. P96]|uniref:Phage holin family protein n=1 Tax=Paenibacillus zeirhizosphaerae TaxID=2987519 RepID=A0ABT9FQ76_9BACL|nr:phage holin family protein [Paenibacillus sp. P96]MDP4096876.1 phage holin family protein [Paenibacillus sp. P96]
MNEKIDQIIKGLAGGAMIGYFFGGWTTMLALLWWMVIIDFFTGWAAAWINGDLKSRVGYYGIARKVAIFLMVGMAHMIDQILGGSHYFRDAVIFFYLANELLSVIENVGRMGVPMPAVLSNAVKIFESKSGEQKKEENHELQSK